MIGTVAIIKAIFISALWTDFEFYCGNTFPIRLFTTFRTDNKGICAVDLISSNGLPHFGFPQL